MLSLLDEQISSQVAAALAALSGAVPVVSLYAWRAGALTGADDALVLQRARGRRSEPLISTIN